MEKCAICDRSELYQCNACNVILCEEHKILHEQSMDGKHVFVNIGKRLNSEEIANILKKLTMKIKLAGECQVLILKETNNLIRKIKSMCMLSINIIKNKQQNYINLLRTCQKRLLPAQMKEIELQLNTAIAINVPACEIKEIEEFYKLDFLRGAVNLNLTCSSELKDHLLFDNFPDIVNCLALTSDNNFLISGFMDSTVRIWNLLDKTQESILKGHANSVSNLVITSDNKYIISSSYDETIRIWNILEKKQVAVLESTISMITCLAVTKDNKYIISGSDDRAVDVWSLQDKRLEAVLQVMPDSLCSKVSSVAVTSDNKYVVSGVVFDPSRAAVIIWNLKLRRQEASLQGHSGIINSIAITSDNAFIVSVSNDCTVRIWNLKEKTVYAVLQGHTNSVTCVVVTSDHNYIVSGSSDHTIIIWNFKDKRQVSVFQGHTGPVTCIGITLDNKYIFSGGEDYSVRIWNLQQKIQRAPKCCLLF